MAKKTRRERIQNMIANLERELELYKAPTSHAPDKEATIEWLKGKLDAYRRVLKSHPSVASQPPTA